MAEMTESQWRERLKTIEQTINQLEDDFERMAKKLNELRSLRDSIKWQLDVTRPKEQGLGRRKIRWTSQT